MGPSRISTGVCGGTVERGPCRRGGADIRLEFELFIEAIRVDVAGVVDDAGFVQYTIDQLAVQQRRFDCVDPSVQERFDDRTTEHPLDRPCDPQELPLDAGWIAPELGSRVRGQFRPRHRMARAVRPQRFQACKREARHVLGAECAVEGMVVVNDNGRAWVRQRRREIVGDADLIPLSPSVCYDVATCIDRQQDFPFDLAPE